MLGYSPLLLKLLIAGPFQLVRLLGAVTVIEKAQCNRNGRSDSKSKALSKRRHAGIVAQSMCQKHDTFRW
jgi:hypothetical protein